MTTKKQVSHKAMSLDDIDKKIFPDYDRFILPEISRRKATFNTQRKRGRLDGKAEAALRILIRLTRIEICKLYVSDDEQYKALMSPQYDALPVEINMVEMAKIMNPDLNTPQYKWDSREVLAKSKSSYDFFAVLENPDLAFFIEPYANYKQPQPRTITRTRLGITQTFTQRDPVYKENSSRVKDENGFTVLRPFGRGNIRYWISKEWLLGIPAPPHAASDNNGVTGTPDTSFLGTTVGNSYQSESEKNLNGLRPNLNSFSDKRESGVFSAEKTIFKAAIAEKEEKTKQETEVKNKRNIAPAPPPQTPELRKETFERLNPSNITPLQLAKNLPESLRSSQLMPENLTNALQKAQDLDAYALRLWQRVKDLNERYWTNGQVRYNRDTLVQWRLPDYIQDETEYDDQGKSLCIAMLQYDQLRLNDSLGAAYHRLYEAVDKDYKWLEKGDDRFIFHLRGYLSLERSANQEFKYKNGCLRFRLEQLYPLSTQQSHPEDATTGNILAAYAHKLGKFNMNVHQSETWLQNWIDRYTDHDTEDLKTLRQLLRISTASNSKIEIIKNLDSRLRKALNELKSPEYREKMDNKAEKQRIESADMEKKAVEKVQINNQLEELDNTMKTEIWIYWNKLVEQNKDKADNLMKDCIAETNKLLMQSRKGESYIFTLENVFKKFDDKQLESYRKTIWRYKILEGLKKYYPHAEFEKIEEKIRDLKKSKSKM